jgi:nicotinamide-nucleotide amidase
VTTAESCTGGWVAKAITDIAGSSAWFERGFVTYSNEAKSQMIGVREATLEQHGAVSEPVVVEMAIGALARRAQIMPFRLAASPGRTAAATKSLSAPCGLASPRKGRDHPAGMLCGDREAVRRQATAYALNRSGNNFYKILDTV